MFKKIATFFVLGLLVLNIYGCVALIAGAAAGTGTAIWLSGKLTQEFHKPYDQTVSAAKKALESLKLEVTKETKEETVTQLKGQYSDGTEMWVDICKVTDDSSKVEVRVGAVGPNKDAATKILKRIQEYL